MERVVVWVLVGVLWVSTAHAIDPADSDPTDDAAATDDTSSKASRERGRREIESSEHLSPELKERLLDTSSESPASGQGSSRQDPEDEAAPPRERGSVSSFFLGMADKLKQLRKERWSSGDVQKEVGPAVREVMPDMPDMPDAVVGEWVVETFPEPQADSVGPGSTEIAPILLPMVRQPAPSAAHSGVSEQSPFIETVVLGTVEPGSPPRWFCSGVIIADRAVLTAAHCAHARHVGIGYRIGALRETHRVARAVVAPDGSDAAVLLLEQSRVSVIPQVRLRLDSAPPRGFLTVIGFGSNRYDAHGGSGRMRQVDIIAQGWGCDAHRARVFGCQEGKEFLLHSAEGNDTCVGDSGGPVYESTSAGKVLVGITSRPVPVPGAKCGNGGIYVRVDALADWLGQVSADLMSERKQR